MWSFAGRWRIRGGESRALAKGVRVLWRGCMRTVERVGILERVEH